MQLLQLLVSSGPQLPRTEPYTYSHQLEQFSNLDAEEHDEQYSNDQQYKFEQTIDTYNYQTPNYESEQQHEGHLYLSLVHQLEQELERKESRAIFYTQASIPPIINAVLRQYNQHC